MNLMNTAKTFALLSVLTGILLAIGYYVGGSSGVLVAFALSVVINFVSYWWSDKIVLKMYGAKTVERKDAPWLHDTVERLCKDAGLPKPPIYLVRTNAPNAFATGRNPQHAAVAVTTGLMDALEKDEVAAVLAHEIGHVANRDTLISTMAATLAGAITWIAHAALFAGDRNRSAAGALAMMIVVPIAASLVRLAISRSREFGADTFGAHVSGQPLKLASALQKIEHAARGVRMNAEPATAHMFIINPLTAENLAGLFSTHPPTAERVRRLKEMAKEGS